jgi:hypothetical protein
LRKWGRVAWDCGVLLKVANGLGTGVFPKDEVRGLEIMDGLIVRVGDDDVDHDDAGVLADCRNR